MPLEHHRHGASFIRRLHELTCRCCQRKTCQSACLYQLLKPRAWRTASYFLYIYIFFLVCWGFALTANLYGWWREIVSISFLFFLLHKGCLPQLMCYIILEMCFGIIRSCWPLLLSPCVSVRVFHPAQILEEMRALLKEPPQGPSTRVVSLIAS